MSYCKMTLIGNLGRDAELKYTPNGDPVCSFSLAHSWEDKEGERTEWFSASLWGKRAEALAQYLTKGQQVYIEGGFSTRTYEDKAGTPRTSLEIRVTEVQLIGKRNSEGDAQPRAAQPVPDEDIPF